MRYKLPCSCGHTLVIDVAQAGGSMRCRCGRDLEVPALRHIRQLDLATDDPGVTGRRGASWGLRQGALFAAGAVLIAIGLTAAAYYQWHRWRLDVDAVAWENLDEELKMIDQASINQCWTTWLKIRDAEIGPYNPPEFIMNRAVSAAWLKIVIGGLSVAALGLVLVVSAFLVPSSRADERPE
ncbi:MAG: hypothetical protein FJ276_00705 [Planctomycetes bacterium]|nr:hypothetical protein [Planctomycetota bacterium]